jgi:hypothetical protein
MGYSYSYDNVITLLNLFYNSVNLFIDLFFSLVSIQEGSHDLRNKVLISTKNYFYLK